MTGRSCVYTVLFGGYEDLLEQPTAETSDAQFVCFTDDPELQSDTWHVIQIDPLFPADPVRSSRYPKICAHHFLLDYERSLYIDNAVLLHRSPEDLMEELLPGDAAMGAVGHSFRETLEDEFAAVIEAGFDTREVCLEQLQHYRSEYPGVLSLRPIAGGILARRHRRSDVIDVMNRWWYHVLRYSRRDQLSLLVALAGSSVEPVVAEFDLHHNSYFRWPASTNRKVLNDQRVGLVDERSKLESALEATEEERSNLEMLVRALEADREDARRRMELLSEELEDERRFGLQRWAVEHSWSDRVRLALPQRWGLLNRAMRDRW